ncbi:hypothetical protein [Roseateles asaccharophilus]|uniref:J domain-containing protein n=1 Tax=Roseateles asaccharophilus TaxID=582607 RepID=A0ABU2A9E9_9BURK|nr:hypothetical protein [Roseateles asaccharophilus]MDR7332643.1 hypothetical protein [Roseateles asaccharophilus]
MWEEDWARLGIDATTDLAAIKKAYAAKLKVTRPDDDAEAYQALRAAYERAQQWAKWQRENPEEQPAVIAAAEPAPPVEQQAPPAEEAEPVPEYVLQPQHLIHELELHWRRTGEAALLHAWADTRRELDQQPLSRQAEFSAAFAQWALSLPTLPDEFLKALDAQFGWLNDFRTERQLGVELAHALHDAFDERLRPAPIPAPVHELGAPLVGLDALQQAGGAWWRLQLLLLLLQPTLARNQSLLGAQWLRKLGLDLHAQRWLDAGVKRGLWWRVGLAGALCFGGGLLVFGDAIIAGAHALGWLLSTGAVMLVGLFAATLIGVGPTLTHGQKRLALPLERWRRHSMQPVLGLVWLLFAAWLAWLSEQEPAAGSGVLSVIPDWLLPWACGLFGLAGLVAAWPLLPLHGWVVAGLSPLVGFLFIAALGRWLPEPTCLLLALAWMLLAAAVHEERVRATGFALWPLRPMLNALALAQRWTYSVALLPMACAAAYIALNDGPARASTVFLIWVFGNLGTAWLQDKADAWALKQLPAPAAV